MLEKISLSENKGGSLSDFSNIKNKTNSPIAKSNVFRVKELGEKVVPFFVAFFTSFILAIILAGLTTGIIYILFHYQLEIAGNSEGTIVEKTQYYADAGLPYGSAGYFLWRSFRGGEYVSLNPFNAVPWLGPVYFFLQLFTEKGFWQIEEQIAFFFAAIYSTLIYRILIRKGKALYRKYIFKEGNLVLKEKSELK